MVNFVDQVWSISLIGGKKAVSVLTGLPVLLMAIVAIPGSLLIARLGARRALAAGLLAVAVGAALRGAGPSPATLFAMTLVMGAGVAVCEWVPALARAALAVGADGLLVEAHPAPALA